MAKTSKTTKKISFRPLADKVLVKPDDAAGERRLASGIIIPETAQKDKLLTGTVVAVGPGKKDDSGHHIHPEVAPGDEILFKKPWDEPIKLNGEEHYVLSESEISLVKSH